MKEVKQHSKTRLLCILAALCVRALLSLRAIGLKLFGTRTAWVKKPREHGWPRKKANACDRA